MLPESPGQSLTASPSPDLSNGGDRNADHPQGRDETHGHRAAWSRPCGAHSVLKRGVSHPRVFSCTLFGLGFSAMETAFLQVTVWLLCTQKP